MNQFAWDKRSYIINGERKFLVSGELHYFRVPKQDWKARLILLKQAGGNCVATYIPWILHEPTEGDIRFGDIPERDLRAFLQLCKELKLMVICRPGPYQYSELKYDGIPGWLCENYPEILARDINGKIFRGSSVSYTHPTFLAKVKAWFDIVCPIIAEYTVSKGGTITMVQIDNELMGIHEWFGGWDYNSETMGFGKEDGGYARFLRNRYTSIADLNTAYDTSYTSFAEIYPKNDNNTEGYYICRRSKDYQDFYLSTIADYVSTLYDWMASAGIDCQIVHNSGNPNMNGYFLDTVKRLKDNFLLGCDHYYNLDQDWKQNNPTPQYAINIFISNEMLRLMGYPPTVFEIPGGSFSDWPPILPEDVLCCLMTNTSLGSKGVNYYIFTGGPNPEGVSHFGKVYDYGAPIGASGEIRPTYQSITQYGEFLEQNSWLADADRVSDFNIGLDWEQSRSKHYLSSAITRDFTSTQAWEFLRKGLLTTAFCGGFSAEMLDLNNPNIDTDTAKPLFVTTSTCMSEDIQRSLVSFVKRGGKLCIAPVIPTLDESFKECTILSDFLGAKGSEIYNKTSPIINVGSIENILVNGHIWRNLARPQHAKAIAYEIESQQVLGWKKDFADGGAVIWLGFNWKHSKFEHTHMLEYLLSELGCTNPIIRCSNQNIWVSLRTNRERSMLFVMNLFSSPQKTQIKVKLGHSNDYIKLQPISLKPMEVAVIDLTDNR